MKEPFLPARGLLIRALIVVSMLAGAAMARAGTVTGSVTYRERIAVPPGAVLEVRLADVSRMDVAANILSLQRFALDHVPFAFALGYDDALIEPALSYAVQAEILHGGDVLYRSTRSYPVLTRGAGDSVDIVVERATAGAQASPASLAGTRWQVFDIRGRALITDKRPSIRFLEGGEFGAHSGCNQYVGTAVIEGGAIRFPQAMAGTQMACPEPYGLLERDFIAALHEVAAYLRDGDNLALLDQAGNPLLRLKAEQ
ncbi:MAG: YbaY family lipoprotein [Jhaorihella sp.]